MGILGHHHCCYNAEDSWDYQPSKQQPVLAPKSVPVDSRFPCFARKGDVVAIFAVVDFGIVVEGVEIGSVVGNYNDGWVMDSNFVLTKSLWS
jgi:hypothetical protein